MNILRSKSTLQKLDRSKLNVIELKGEKLARLHTIQLAMFQDLLQLCEKHNITILLGGGTFLGAVRHRGYIPWDDDIDLMMTRANFEKLKQVFKEISDKYELQYTGLEHPSYIPFAKIMKYNTRYIEIGSQSVPKFHGVYIDIFVIENVPDQPLLRKWYGIRSLFWHYVVPSVEMFQHRSVEQKNLYSNSTAGKLNYAIRLTLGFLFSYRKVERWFEKLEKFDRKYEHKNTKYMTIPSGRGHYFKEMQLSSLFLDTQKYPFEHLQCAGVKDAHRYLSQLYGENYMEIPEESKREYHYISKFKEGDYE